MSNNKQGMKLYTEEQVNKIAIQVKDYGYWDTKYITPIELPNDEEIDEESPYVPNDASIDFWAHKEGFIDGAKWMRDKIKLGNNEQQ